jgi:hypothetical protein
MIRRHIIKFFFKQYFAVVKEYRLLLILVGLAMGFRTSFEGEGFHPYRGLAMFFLGTMSWLALLTILFTLYWLYQYFKRKRYQ